MDVLYFTQAAMQNLGPAGRDRCSAAAGWRCGLSATTKLGLGQLGET